jgi:hypothetical protein
VVPLCVFSAPLNDYAKFITPAELDKMAVTAGFTRHIIGLLITTHQPNVIGCQVQMPMLIIRMSAAGLI